MIRKVGKLTKTQIATLKHMHDGAAIHHTAHSFPAYTLQAGEDFIRLSSLPWKSLLRLGLISRASRSDPFTITTRGKAYYRFNYGS